MPLRVSTKVYAHVYVKNGLHLYPRPLSIPIEISVTDYGFFVTFIVVVAMVIVCWG